MDISSMNRDEVLSTIKNCANSHILCELATGFGKTRCAIEYLKSKKINNLLIVVPRLVLITTWKEELIKWNASELKDVATFSTYVSLPKHKDTQWDAIIFDEVHHMSDRCFEAFEDMKFNYFVGLSATITRNMKYDLKLKMPDLQIFKVALKDAINTEVIPDPLVITIPLHLNNTRYDCAYKPFKNSKTVFITEEECYKRMLNQINAEKFKVDRGKPAHFYKALCNQRLVWLSNQKIKYTKQILDFLKNEKILIFCSNIKETESFGCHAIHSKNKKEQNQEILDAFNSNAINHLACCNSLDEGVNLTNCQFGIFNRLNNSEIKVVQKNGRILRHKNPIIIIPYFKDTWEETLKDRMLLNYNPDKIVSIFINQLNLYLNK